MCALLETVERYLLWYFDILGLSFSGVSCESGCINLQLEAEAIDHLDLGRRQTVQFGHALNLAELNVIAVLELMSLVLVNSDNSRVLLSDINYDEGFSFFSVCVSYHEFISVV